MDKFTISGPSRLEGEIKVSGAKNVAMKVILAGLLTDKPIYVRNVPLISSVYGTAEIVKPLGVKVDIGADHSLTIQGDDIRSFSVPLELGGHFRSAAMVLGPLLARFGEAVVPNPGGCRLGKRPIDRHIEGLLAMGAKVTYKDGFFYAKASKLQNVRYKFSKNTHTGTETLILASVLTPGEAILENVAQEPEIDDLIKLLNLMGAKIRRIKPRTIAIEGVKKLHGAQFSIMPDRNEVVTFAIGAVASGGDVIIDGTQREYLTPFLKALEEIGACWQPVSKEKTRFYKNGRLKSVSIATSVHPGFMTDWQAPWALLMTQATGVSTIHETIYEDRFGYVAELVKMGARIDFFNPKVKYPSKFYNFNWSDRKADSFQAIRILGPTMLHNAVLQVMDLRAGATLVLAAIIAQGKSVLYGIEHIDRGYEEIAGRLKNLGVKIKRERDST